MKHKENAGKHQTGKAGTSRRRHLPRLSAVSGLALTALLLSAGISEQACALEFTFEYTYTIIANTCNLSAQGTRQDGSLTGSAANLYVDWGTVTKDQLTSEKKASKKTFGLVMECKGDIWQPTLTVTGSNGSSSDLSAPFYVTDNTGSGAGFAVRVKENGGVTSGTALRLGTPTVLNEVADSNKRNITLEAWPTKIPDKTLNLSSGNAITGTVTIKVSYN